MASVKPTLDLSFLIEEPEFSQLVSVIRREEVVNQQGRGETRNKVFNDVLAVVIPVDTAIGGNTVEATPDEQHRASNLIVITKFRLRSVSAGYQADLVMWEGDPYKVTLINDYSLYGEGFIRAEVAAQQSLDNPPGVIEEAEEPAVTEPESDNG